MSRSEPSASQPASRGRLVLALNAIAWGNAVIGPLLPPLVDRGWEVHLLVDPGPVRQEDLPPGVILHPIALPRRISPLADARVLASWTRLIRSLDPQVVVGISPKGALLSLLAAKLAGVPARLYWIRGAKWDGMEGRSGQFLRAMDKVVIAASTAQLAVSPSISELYVEQGVTRRPVTVLGRGSSRGVDVQKFRPAPEPRPAEGGTALRLGFVGRVAADKGIDQLLTVLDLVQQAVPATLTVIGPRDEENPVDDGVWQRLTEDPAVRYLGARADVADQLRELDFFVFPSHREGLPNALLEAGATGLPVFAWDVTGVRDVVVNGVTGELFPLGECRAMADAIVALARDPSRGQQMSAAARALIVQEFSDQVVLGRVLDWIDQNARGY